jgi:hypothetical protein
MILHAGDEKFEFSPKDILNVEAIAVKRKTGLDFQPWMEALSRFEAEAMTALVWVAKKRQDPTLRFEDVSFPLGSIDFEMTPEEEQEAKAASLPKAGEDPAVST